MRDSGIRLQTPSRKGTAGGGVGRPAPSAGTPAPSAGTPAPSAGASSKAAQTPLSKAAGIATVLPADQPIVTPSLPEAMRWSSVDLGPELPMAVFTSTERWNPE